MPLAHGGAVKLTTSRYFTPSGASIQGRGLMPDIVETARPSAPADLRRRSAPLSRPRRRRAHWARDAQERAPRLEHARGQPHASRALRRPDARTGDAAIPVSSPAMLAWLIDLVLHLDRTWSSCSRASTCGSTRSFSRSSSARPACGDAVPARGLAAVRLSGRSPRSIPPARCERRAHGGCWALAAVLGNTVNYAIGRASGRRPSPAATGC